MSASQSERPTVVIEPGTILGKCEIRRELGRGGMGTVYLAHHRTLDVPVAVKVLSPEVARVSPAAAERFLREARLTARIRHPNLVGVMDTDTDSATGVSFLVMEFVDGPSAAALIGTGAMEPQQAVRIAIGVARALEAAQQHKVIHRDVKPANILVASDGTVKLTDLGLAKDLEFSGQLTASSATLGTPLYMSPEQVRKGPLDSRTDIYSLGITLFEMLTAHPPYTGYSFYEIAEMISNAPVPDLKEYRDLDQRLCAIVKRMMAKLPEERYTTPNEVVKALGAWLGETPADGAVVRVMSLSSAGARMIGSAQPSGSSRPTLNPSPARPTGPQRVLSGASSGNQPSGAQTAVASMPAMMAPPPRSNAVLISVALAVATVAALLIVRPELFHINSPPPREEPASRTPSPTEVRPSPTKSARASRTH